MISKLFQLPDAPRNIIEDSHETRERHVTRCTLSLLHAEALYIATKRCEHGDSGHTINCFAEIQNNRFVYIGCQILAILIERLEVIELKLSVPRVCLENGASARQQRHFCSRII